VDDRVNFALVGAFVLVLATALIAAVLWLAVGLGGKRKFDPYESIIAESVAGLDIEAPVKYLGVDVGKVSKIAIDPRNPNQVRLRLLIERGTPIKRDTSAVLKSQGLTGIAYIELSGGSPNSPPLVSDDSGPPPVIPSRPSLGFRAESLLGSVLANLDQLAGNLNAALDTDNRASLKATLADTSTLVHGLAAQQQALHAALTGIARAADEGAKAAAVGARGAERLGPAIERITAAAQALDKMADATRAAATGTGKAADETGAAMRQFDAETLPELRRLLAELSRSTESIGRVADRLDRDPALLVRGAAVPGPGPGERVTP